MHERPRHSPTDAVLASDGLLRHVPVTQAFLVLPEVLRHRDLLETRGAVAARERDGVVLYDAA